MLWIPFSKATLLLVIILFVLTSCFVCCLAEQQEEAPVSNTNDQAKVEDVKASVQKLLDQTFQDSRAQLAQLDLGDESLDIVLKELANRYLLHDDEEDEEEDASMDENGFMNSDEAEEEVEFCEADVDGEDNEQDEEELHPKHSLDYADRHLDDVISIVDDPDCMTREFDVRTEEYDSQEAADVLSKCRLIILRNVYHPDFILKQFKPTYAKYLHALQQQTVDPKRRVIYDPSTPTQRYEIMLPKKFAMKELVQNPKIQEIIREPNILSPHHFLHSLGTVVTEPGAPHQHWHEEDWYIFDSWRSFTDFGVAGHDLPPYVINMFSPLLNLTHDHGPTDFCVGSSITTGLLSGDFYVYDDDKLSSDQTGDRVFFELMKFHRGSFFQEEDDHLDQFPCPARHLRSVLLNVGDVVLFDYQIIHRAGHNNAMENDDTRAQIYMAFARNWFRDLNYDANLMDDDEKEDSDHLTRNTRYALDVDEDIFVEPEQKDDETSDDTTGGKDKNNVPLERLRNIIPQAPLREKDYYKERSFVVSNIDLEEGTVSLSLTEGNRNMHGALLVPPGGHHELKARPGTKLSLRATGDRRLLKTWVVPYYIQQLVVSKEIVGLLDAPVAGSSSDGVSPPTQAEASPAMEAAICEDLE